MKIIQYGCGKMSTHTMSYSLNKGYELVGAIDINESIVGKSVNELYGVASDVKVTHSSNARKLLEEVKPDICIVTTMSLLSDLEEPLTLCAELGVNAITICEEAFYPFNSNPNLTKKIDKLAKENNCTITGTGYQDAFWGNLITTLMGASGSITKVKGSSSYNVEDYGIALAKGHGAGLSKEDFEKEIASVDNISEEERTELINTGKFLPSYMWNVNGWFCDKLGLKVLSQTQKCVPTFHTEDIHSKTLGMDIKKGYCTGMRAVVTTTTDKGIVFETECVGKVYSENDFDSNVWTVEGEPTTTLTVERPNTVELTCGTVVNRLEHVVNAKPGFVPTSQLGEMTYKV